MKKYPESENSPGYWLSTLHWPSSISFCQYGQFMHAGDDIVAIGTRGQIFLYKFHPQTTEHVFTYTIGHGEMINNAVKFRPRWCQLDLLFIVTDSGTPIVLMYDGSTGEFYTSVYSGKRRLFKAPTRQSVLIAIDDIGGLITFASQQESQLFIMYLDKEQEGQLKDEERLKKPQLDRIFPIFNRQKFEYGDTFYDLQFQPSSEIGVGPRLAVHMRENGNETLTIFLFYEKAIKFIVAASGMLGKSSIQTSHGKMLYTKVRFSESSSSANGTVDSSAIYFNSQNEISITPLGIPTWADNEYLKDNLAIVHIEDGSTRDKTNVYITSSDGFDLEAGQLINLKPDDKKVVVIRVNRRPVKYSGRNTEQLVIVASPAPMRISDRQYSSFRDPKEVYTLPDVRGEDFKNGLPEIPVNNDLFKPSVISPVSSFSWPISPKIDSAIQISELRFLATTSDTDKRLLLIELNSRKSKFKNQEFPITYMYLGEFPESALLTKLSDANFVAKTADESLVIFQLDTAFIEKVLSQNKRWNKDYIDVGEGKQGFKILGKMANIAPIVSGDLSSIDGQVSHGSLKVITRNDSPGHVLSFTRGYKPSAIKGEIEGLNCDGLWLLNGGVTSSDGVVNDQQIKILIASAVNSNATLAFAIIDSLNDLWQLDQWKEIELNKRTLLIESIEDSTGGGSILQVTTDSVSWLRNNGKLLHRQLFEGEDEKIHFAVVNSKNKHVVCSIGRSRLVVLDETLNISVTKEFDIDISALAISNGGEYLAASFWDSKVNLLNPLTLDVYTTKLVDSRLPRSLLFSSADMVLQVGTADGTLLTLEIARDTFSLDEISRISIGCDQVCLQKMDHSVNNILAYSDSSFIVNGKGKITSRLLAGSNRMPLVIQDNNNDDDNNTVPSDEGVVLLGVPHDDRLELMEIDMTNDEPANEYHQFNYRKGKYFDITSIPKFNVIASLYMSTDDSNCTIGSAFVEIADEFTGNVLNKEVLSGLREEPLCIEYVKGESFLFNSNNEGYLVIGSQLYDFDTDKYNGILRLYAIYRSSEGEMVLSLVDDFNLGSPPGCISCSPDIPEVDFIVGTGPYIKPMKLEPYLEAHNDFCRLTHAKFPNELAIFASAPILCADAFGSSIVTVDMFGVVKMSHISRQDDNERFVAKVCLTKAWPSDILLLNETTCLYTDMNGRIILLKTLERELDDDNDILYVDAAYPIGEVITKIIPIPSPICDIARAYLLGRDGGVYLFGKDTGTRDTLKTISAKADYK